MLPLHGCPAANSLNMSLQPAPQCTWTIAPCASSSPSSCIVRHFTRQSLHSQDDLDNKMDCIGFACCRCCYALLRIAHLWMVLLVSLTMRSRCCAKPTTSSLPSSWASMNMQQGLTSSLPRSACHILKCLYSDLVFCVCLPSMSASTGCSPGLDASSAMAMSPALSSAQ